jgi:2-dehydro-3-deoxyphosphogluconate aldolase / (4S)-4-hydroxy-2-oxoglutarate aldolase
MVLQTSFVVPMQVSSFKVLPILGILRGVSAERIAPLVDAVTSAGLRAIEITMNTAGAPGLIREMVRRAGGRLMVGAGTVLSREDLLQALDAGATFAVSPTLVPAVVEYCVDHSIPVFPGALTPQEIHNAWSAGATMVKVFPAGFFGPNYLREIKGPFHDVELMAVGGVSADNLQAFLLAGASAVAFGGSVFRADWLARGEFGLIEAAVRRFVDAYRAV